MIEGDGQGSAYREAITRDTWHVTFTERELVELLAFLFASARCLQDEPADYGTMRLMSASARLAALAHTHGSRAGTQFHRLLQDELPNRQSRRLQDATAYMEFIDECCRAAAVELMRLDASSEGAPQ